jgi:hypothetical protein
LNDFTEFDLPFTSGIRKIEEEKCVLKIGGFSNLDDLMPLQA